MRVHRGTAAQLGVDHLLAEKQGLRAHLRFLGPVAAELRQVVSRTAEVKHGRGIGRQGNRLLLLMADFAPGLDDVLLRIGHVVQRHVDGILVVAQLDVGLHASLHGVRGRRNVVEPCGRISVVVSDGQGRFEEVFVARTAVHLPPAAADTAVRGGVHAPTQFFQVGLIQQPFTKIALVEAAVVAHLQHQVGAVSGNAYLFHVTGIQCSGGEQCKCRRCDEVFHGI